MVVRKGKKIRNQGKENRKNYAELRKQFSNFSALKKQVTHNTEPCTFIKWGAKATKKSINRAYASSEEASQVGIFFQILNVF